MADLRNGGPLPLMISPVAESQRPSVIGYRAYLWAWQLRRVRSQTLGQSVTVTSGHDADTVSVYWQRLIYMVWPVDAHSRLPRM